MNDSVIVYYCVARHPVIDQHSNVPTHPECCLLPILLLATTESVPLV